MTVKYMRITVFGAILTGLQTAVWAASPVTPAFTYQGQLLDAGAAAEGEYDFEFRLWDAATEGSLVSGPIAMENLAVAGGLFTVELDFGASPWSGKALWLDIRVRPGDSADEHTELTPRQPVTAAPYALGLRPGTIVAGSGGAVGVITGINTDSNDNAAGILGSSSATSGFNFGVYGRASSPQGAAVHGFADSGSGANFGVLGWSLSNAGTGVYGLASSSSGANYGVYGKTASPDGTALFGLADANSGNGVAVHGQADSPSGYAAYFTGGRNYFEGNVGIGTLDPDRPLALVGAGVEGEWLSLKDTGGTTRWHLNDLSGGLNFAETGVADSRLFLGAGGNVGIGTSTPTRPLSVRAEADGDLFSIRNFSDAERWNVSLLNNDLVFDAGSANKRIRLLQNGDMFIDGGRVGIGTDTPTLPLSIRANGDGDLLSIRNSNDGERWFVGLVDNDLVFDAGLPNKGIRFLQNGDMFIDGGRVGIGTPSPAAKLTLPGGLDGADTFESGLAFKGIDLPGDDFSRAGIWAVGKAGYNGDLVFGTDGDGEENHAVTEKMRISADGSVGIGTDQPSGGLHVEDPTLVIGDLTEDTFAPFKLTNTGGAALLMSGWGQIDSVGDALFLNGVSGNDVIVGANLGIGTDTPQSDIHIERALPGIRLQTNDDNSDFFVHCDPYGSFGIRDLNSNDTVSQLYIGTSGITSVKALEIRGGSDIAEPFNVNIQGTETRRHEGTEARSQEGTEVKPGMVVCIDPTNAGELVLSRRPYDRSVAGIISGAGGVKTGMTLQQKDSIASGEHPVALTGRVYCLVDADAAGSIQPGDLLTTSDTPGHAMKVTDHGKAVGAVLGKAMSSLERGRGLVLVLVSLQ